MGMIRRSFTNTIFLALLSVVIFLYSPCCAATVTLSWDANTESDLAGYKVYYKSGTSTLPFNGTDALEGVSPIDVNSWTTATISGLDPSKAYYFTVSAYNTSGAESTYSNIVYVPIAVTSDLATIYTGIKGDIDGDGFVGLYDVLLALNFATGKLKPSDGQFA
ncbi:MAG: fibronectin type III domain-containing protein, partial [Pseudomonadota bacterium]